MEMDVSNSMFFGRDILIATKHKKDEVIAPILKDLFKANVFTAKDLDTDVLGTFSGEVERLHTPIDTARMKCKAAADLYDAKLVIASEGSFGSHPELILVPADDEILLLTDYENDIEIAVREISLKTNFAAKQAYSLEEVKDFAYAVEFPGHKIILRKSATSYDQMNKSIVGWDDLITAAQQFLTAFGSVFIETDMRAMNNPTRMSVIAAATKKLADLMISTCPHCKAPGFGIGDVVRGLPCSHCNAPTKSIYKHVYACRKCAFSQEIHVNKELEDPMFCDWCNP